ncbi:MAG TPA: MFS transporter [Acidimicrobiales bacterium]|nr:MFS transporter [Acidimicrobiales bacterium]
MHKRTLGGRFWRLWTAVAASSLGDGIFSVALPLLALRFTRNPLAIAGVAITGQIPVVVAALPVGTWADRLNRRRLIISIEVARFGLLGAFAALVALDLASLVLVYIAAFLLGGLNIAFDIVGNACVPSMVRNDDLVRANAHLLNAEMTAENLLGQALGGAAMAVSRSLPFVANAVSLAVSAALVKGAVPDNDPVESESSAWKDLTEGLRWFLGNPLLRLLTSVIASLAFCQGIVLGLLALYARERLHLGNAGFGLLLAVASVGTVIGGIFARRIHDRLGSGHTILLAGAVFGLAYPVLAITHSPLVAAAVLLAQEAAVIVGNTASRSLRQRMVPGHMQGRAASANTVVILSCFPLGGLVGGLVAGALGLPAAFLAAGGLQVALLGLTGPRLLARIRAVRIMVHITDIRRSLELDGDIDLTDDRSTGGPTLTQAAG